VNEGWNHDFDVICHVEAAETVTNKLEKVNPNRVIVDYKAETYYCFSRIKALISVVATNDARLDPIFEELEKTAGRSKKFFEIFISTNVTK